LQQKYIESGQNGLTQLAKHRLPGFYFVRCVVVVTREVLLHDVVHDVMDASLHLIVGCGERIIGVEDRELGHEPLIEDVSHFEGVGSVGDDSAGIHLAASTRHCQHAGNGEDDLPHWRVLLLQIEGIPIVTLIVVCSSHGLGVVADAATTIARMKPTLCFLAMSTPSLSFSNVGLDFI